MQPGEKTPGPNSVWLLGDSCLESRPALLLASHIPNVHDHLGWSLELPGPKKEEMERTRQGKGNDGCIWGGERGTQHFPDGQNPIPTGFWSLSLTLGAIPECAVFYK